MFIDEKLVKHLKKIENIIEESQKVLSWGFIHFNTIKINRPKVIIF